VAREDAVVGLAVPGPQLLEVTDARACGEPGAAVVVAAVAGEGDTAEVVDEIQVASCVPRAAVSRNPAVAQIKHVAFIQREYLGIEIAPVDHVLSDFPYLPVPYVQPVVPYELIQIEVGLGGPGKAGLLLLVQIYPVKLMHHPRVVRVSVGNEHVVRLVRKGLDDGSQIALAHAGVDDQRALASHQDIYVDQAKLVDEVRILCYLVDQWMFDAHVSGSFLL